MTSPPDNDNSLIPPNVVASSALSLTKLAPIIGAVIIAGGGIVAALISRTGRSGASTTALPGIPIINSTAAEFVTTTGEGTKTNGEGTTTTEPKAPDTPPPPQVIIVTIPGIPNSIVVTILVPAPTVPSSPSTQRPVSTQFTATTSTVIPGPSTTSAISSASLPPSSQPGTTNSATAPSTAFIGASTTTVVPTPSSTAAATVPPRTTAAPTSSPSSTSLIVPPTSSPS